MYELKLIISFVLKRERSTFPQTENRMQLLFHVRQTALHMRLWKLYFITCSNDVRLMYNKNLAISQDGV